MKRQNAGAPPLCKCGCGQSVEWRPGGWYKHVKGHYTKRGIANPNYRSGKAIYHQSKADTPPLCRCGCGQTTYWLPTGRRWAMYAQGHYTVAGTLNPRYQGGRTRTKQPTNEQPPVCKCGCGEPVGWDGGNGKWHRYGVGHYTKKGPQHPNWIGGTKKYFPYTWDWHRITQETKEHFNFTCQECGYALIEDGPLVHAHHKDNDPSNNSDSNLTVLCEPCHKKHHPTRVKRKGQ